MSEDARPADFQAEPELAVTQGPVPDAAQVAAPAKPARTRRSRQTAPKPAPEQPAASAETPAQPAEKSAQPASSEAAPSTERPRSPRKRSRKAQEVPAAAETSASPEPPVPAGFEALDMDELLTKIPRRRRGRPSKREVEARRAIEAAKADPTPELQAAARASVALLDAAPAQQPQEQPTAPQKQGDSASARPEDSQRGEARPSAEEAPAAEGTAPAEGGYGQRRRHHERRAEDGEQQRPQPKASGGQRPQSQSQPQPKRDRRDDRGQGSFQGNGNNGQPQSKRDRNRPGNGQGQPGGNFSKNDRRNNNRDRNDRNRRDVVVEPKTNRDELEELKVGDLRAKASELGIDPAGLKKPELVDVVYASLVRQEGFFDFRGILDVTGDGFGFVRTKGYLPSEGDVYMGAPIIRSLGLRRGDEVSGIAHAGRPNDKFPGVTKVTQVNGVTPEALRARPRFGDLTPVFPTEPLRMEHGKDSILGRCIDLVAPIGKGQRGLIVSPPKAGKTTVLKKIAESIAANNPEVHLICLLVDERPEEVTDMQRSIKGEVVASTFDMPCDNHIQVSELVIERAKRLVEQGRDVVILLDSITRLARAYNLAQPASGRILSGGVDSTALYPPKRFLGAARNIEGGGSLTILASALVDTGSKMDEVIFEEFKGTGNMELKLDRDLADRRVFPAIDPVSSGTRKEELLLDPGLAPFVWGIRRILANMNSNERAMSSLIRSLKATQNNEEFLIKSAKKAQLQELNAEL
jgi:transcription termination factor Rho